MSTDTPLDDSQIKAGYLKSLETYPDDESFVQFSQLDMACDGDAEFAAELLEIYDESMSDSLMALDKAVAEKNSEGIASAAHAIKGAASNLGLVRVVMAAKHIEHAGHAGKLIEAELAADLRVEIEAAHFFLERFCVHLTNQAA